MAIRLAGECAYGTGMHGAQLHPTAAPTIDIARAPIGGRSITKFPHELETVRNAVSFLCREAESFHCRFLDQFPCRLVCGAQELSLYKCYSHQHESKQCPRLKNKDSKQQQHQSGGNRERHNPHVDGITNRRPKQRMVVENKDRVGRSLRRHKKHMEVAGESDQNKCTAKKQNNGPKREGTCQSGACKHWYVICFHCISLPYMLSNSLKTCIGRIIRHLDHLYATNQEMQMLATAPKGSTAQGATQ